MKLVLVLVVFLAGCAAQKPKAPVCPDIPDIQDSQTTAQYVNQILDMYKVCKDSHGR